MTKTERFQATKIRKQTLYFQSKQGIINPTKPVKFITEIVAQQDAFWEQEDRRNQRASKRKFNVLQKIERLAGYFNCLECDIDNIITRNLNAVKIELDEKGMQINFGLMEFSGQHYDLNEIEDLLLNKQWVEDEIEVQQSLEIEAVHEELVTITQQSKSDQYWRYIKGEDSLDYEDYSIDRETEANMLFDQTIGYKPR